MTKTIPASLVALMLFACSNDNTVEEPQNSSSSEDSSSSSSDNTVEKPKNSLLVNFTSNYTIGALRWMNPNTYSLEDGSITFGQDSKVFAGEGNIFVLSRLPGALACIAPENIEDVSTIKQRALDALNPYEAVVINGKGYIALEDVDYVQDFNLSTCTPGGKINLPISGTNASSIKASGDTLLVILQRRVVFKAPNPGLLVRINASTETLIDTIQLKFHNPHSSVLSKGKLYISALKYDNDVNQNSTSPELLKSGIEVVDLATGNTEILVTGSQLGGGADGIALDEANQILYVSVYAAYGSQSVKPVNLFSKTVGAALSNISDSSGGLVFDEEEKNLFIGDRKAGSGLKVYNPATNSITSINQGGNALPPYSLAIVRW
jgi:hypothetical protein